MARPSSAFSNIAARSGEGRDSVALAAVEDGVEGAAHDPRLLVYVGEGGTAFEGGTEELLVVVGALDGPQEEAGGAGVDVVAAAVVAVVVGRGADLDGQRQVGADR